MRIKLLSALFLSVALLSAPFALTTGCGTPSAQRVAYKTVTTIVFAVDAAKHVYYDYRELHGVTPEIEARFKDVYEKYQGAMRIVKEVYKTQQVPASDDVVTLGNELIGLIQDVTKNFKLKSI